MLASEFPCTPLKISLPENETTVNLKRASFFVIMHSHKGLTHIQSQINQAQITKYTSSTTSGRPNTPFLKCSMKYDGTKQCHMRQVTEWAQWNQRS